MDTNQREQLDKQRKTWNKYSAGWKKWDALIMSAMEPITEKFIKELKLKGTEQVLDVASGTGEPGLSISRLLPEGQVAGVDLSEKMVEIANDKAKLLGITNYKSRVSDSSKLPFEDNFFDHVICRFGIMFFPDIKAGLKEMARALKPGGSMNIVVWASPQQNPFLTIMGMTVMEKLKLPQPPADAPNIFRCAEPGITSSLMKETGLVNVTETNLSGNIIYDSDEHYWDVSKDVAGPIMDALENAPSEVIEEVKKAVIEKARTFVKDNILNLGWVAIFAKGIKQ